MVSYGYGEIVKVAGGNYASKPRPVLVLQNPDFYTGTSLIVAPFTSVANSEIKVRVAVRPTEANGLDRDCYLEVDKLSAIDVSHIGGRVGKLEPELLKEASALAASLICP
jgi:mRNA interferase MazF